MLYHQILVQTQTQQNPLSFLDLIILLHNNQKVLTKETKLRFKNLKVLTKEIILRLVNKLQIVLKQETQPKQRLEMFRKVKTRLSHNLMMVFQQILELKQYQKKVGIRLQPLNHQ